MKRIFASMCVIALLLVAFSTTALALDRDLEWYEQALTGTWVLWDESGDKFTYPGASFWGYSNGTKLVATENTVYLVMWGSTYGKDSAWYEVGFSDDGKYLLLLPANGYKTCAGLYMKQ